MSSKRQVRLSPAEIAALREALEFTSLPSCMVPLKDFMFTATANTRRLAAKALRKAAERKTK